MGNATVIVLISMVVYGAIYCAIMGACAIMRAIIERWVFYGTKS